MALAGGVHAAGLFLPEGPAAGAKAGAAPARTAAAATDGWERRVRIARRQLATARDDVERAGAGRLLLNVKDDVRLHVAVERTAPTGFGYSLSGRVTGGAAQAGFVTLVVHEEAVAGSVWTPDSSWELGYLGDGVHVLRDVTDAPPVECAGALPMELPAAETAVEAGTDDVSVADILVVWTPAEEERAGGEPQILSRIDMAVAYVNDAFERSGAWVRLRLVGAEKVEYMEVDSDTDLIRLAKTDDGHMDGVHDRRNALGADLVLLAASSSVARAQFGGAFSIAAMTNNVVAHELGHNFGIQHERFEFGPWAYKNGFTTAGCEVSIMSYGLECRGKGRRLPFYASPWRYAPGSGRALGTSRFSKDRGARGPADAVLTLNRNRHRVAGYRPSRSGE